MRDNEITFRLHSKQGDAFTSVATEVLYGGAAGGGKSHLMRIASIVWCMSIPGLNVYLFRRIREDLIKNHMDGPKGFYALLAPLVDSGAVKIIKDEIRFWNGSKIYLCHCKDEKHRYKYQGAEMHVLMIDELTHFTKKIYKFLRGRVRAVGLNVPDHYKGLFPRILCGSNPGNIGHTWVKSDWIDLLSPMEIKQMPDDEGGMLRQFIPALLEDNPSMIADDPTYEAKLMGLGGNLALAMRYGDWDVVEGAFFDCFDRKKHVVKPHKLPAHWTRFRSFDWGSAKPFSVGWWAVSDGELPQYPRGALIRYREWYGAKGPDIGLKMTCEAVAAGILEREKGEVITYGVADPAIWQEDGGPSIAERMGPKMKWKKADNRRCAGWDQMRARMTGHDDKPMMYVFETCKDYIRTVPALQHDDVRPEDLDTNAEDHVADETRYGCMSRPYVKPAPQIPKDITALPTLGEMTREFDRRQMEQRQNEDYF